MEGRVHKLASVAVIVLSFLLSVLTFIFHLLTYDDAGSELFESSLTEVSEDYEMEVKEGLTGLGIMVLLAQVLWNLYSLSCVVRKGKQGYLYLCPCHLQLYIHITYSVATALVIVRTFLLDRGYLVAQEIIIGLAAVIATVCCYLAHFKFVKPGRELLQQSKTWDVLLTRLLVHNGINMLGIWLWIESFIYLGAVLNVETDMNETDASTLALSLIAAMLAFSIFDKTFIWDKYMRYSFGTFVVAIWKMFAIVANNWDKERNSIIALVILVALISFLIWKIVIVVKKGLVNPEPLLKNPSEKVKKNSASKMFGGHEVLNVPSAPNSTYSTSPVNALSAPPVGVLSVSLVGSSVPARPQVMPTSQSVYPPSGPAVFYEGRETLLGGTMRSSYPASSNTGNTLYGTPMGILTIPQIGYASSHIGVPQPTNSMYGGYEWDNRSYLI